MKWKEGLALGSDSYTSEWSTDATFQSLTSNNGSTTASRAAAHGAVTGKITETAYFYDTYSADA